MMAGAEVRVGARVLPGAARRGAASLAAALALLACAGAAAAPASAAAPPAAGPASVAATPPAAAVAALLARARELLEQAQRARLAAALLPIAPRWSPRRIATLDVGGALGAMVGADLDGDRRPELVAVTDQAVLVYSLAEGKVRELSRLPFRGDAAAPRSRDPVATVALDRGTREIMAGSSAYARSVRARWRDGALQLAEELEGLPLCEHQRAQLVPGRNYFSDESGAPGALAPLGGPADGRSPSGGAEVFFAQRCRDPVTLGDGALARVEARLPLDGPLRVLVQPRCATPCPPRRHELTGVGVAFDVGDVDRDGRVDVAYSGAGAPGDPDAVRIVAIADPRRTLFRRAFSGGVAAIALLDLDDDGADEVIAAVRLPGSPRVDLWRLR